MSKDVHIDEWVWGREHIVWGFDPSHRYTCKILEPKKGRAGCLSLQYHREKSESWIVFRGEIWIVAVVGAQVCTRVMRRGDAQNLPTGTIHRLMGVSDDAQVIEPSTPDRHAADKAAPKDVVRLHCVLGREVAAPRSEEEATLIRSCIRYTEEAILALEKGAVPPEHQPALLAQYGATKI